jgi:hypothetical protein
LQYIRISSCDAGTYGRAFLAHGKRVRAIVGIIASRFSVSILPASMLLALPGPAQADTAPPVADQPCELHVWPAAAMHSTYYGWTHGSTVDGAAKGRTGYPALPKALSPSDQVHLLASAGIAEKLKLGNCREVIHDTRPDSHALRTTVGRMIPGTPSAYAELFVDEVFFQEDAFTGRHLVLLYRFRQFDTDDHVARAFTTTIRRDLKQPGSNEPSYDPAAAASELDDAYLSAFADFAQALTSGPRKHG